MITDIQSEGNASLPLAWREGKREKQRLMVSHMNAVFVSTQSEVHTGSKPYEHRNLGFLVSPGLCHCPDPQALGDIHYFKSFASASQSGIKSEKSLWIFLQPDSAPASPQLSSSFHCTRHGSSHPTPKNR